VDERERERLVPTSRQSEEIRQTVSVFIISGFTIRYSLARNDMDGACILQSPEPSYSVLDVSASDATSNSYT